MAIRTWTHPKTGMLWTYVRSTFSLLLPKSMRCGFATSSWSRSISLARELRVAVYFSCCSGVIVLCQDHRL